MTLFELTFGRRPFSLTGRTLMDQIESHRTAAVQFPEKWPSNVPLAWRTLLLRLLDKSPERRYANYASLDADLLQVAPVEQTLAGRAHRGLALFVDYVVQLLLFAAMALASIVLDGLLGKQHSAHKFLVQTIEMASPLVLVIPLALSWIEWKGWKTPGRYLFQLRVVDHHGLPLAPRRRVGRSILRNLPILLSLVEFLAQSWRLNAFVSIVNTNLGNVWLLFDALPVLGPRLLTLHDRLFRIRVVLDTSAAPTKPT